MATLAHRTTSVGVTGLEPAAFRSQSGRSTKLSYTPIGPPCRWSCRWSRPAAQRPPPNCRTSSHRCGGNSPGVQAFLDGGGCEPPGTGSRHACVPVGASGGGETRTPNRLLAGQVLYQLSYTPGCVTVRRPRDAGVGIHPPGPRTPCGPVRFRQRVSSLPADATLSVAGRLQEVAPGPAGVVAPYCPS